MDLEPEGSKLVGMSDDERVTRVPRHSNIRDVYYACIFPPHNQELWLGLSGYRDGALRED